MMSVLYDLFFRMISGAGFCREPAIAVGCVRRLCNDDGAALTCVRRLVSHIGVEDPRGGGLLSAGNGFSVF